MKREQKKQSKVLQKLATLKQASLVRRVAKILASVSRYCEIYKVKDGTWYMDLATKEYGDQDDATTYGPFDSEGAAQQYLFGNFANPGSLYTDGSGKRRAPKKSPNGRPVENPGRFWR